MTKIAQMLPKHGMTPLAFLAVGLMFATAVAFAQAPKDKPLSGTLTVGQLQVAFIGSANVGGGKLKYKGKSHDFSIGGLGVGGIGVSRIDATGEVYGLNKLEDFAGAYGQARYGAVIADASTGELWLENTKGVVIHLDAKRKGLALSLGVDGVIIGLQ
jgi:hypothetical protein